MSFIVDELKAYQSKKQWFSKILYVKIFRFFFPNNGKTVWLDGPRLTENLLVLTLARKFSSRYFFLISILQSDDKLLGSKMQKNGVTDFVSETKSVQNYLDFENLAHVQQGF